MTSITWDAKFGPAQVIQIVLLLVGILGGGFSFYYKANSTADKVDLLSEALKEKGKEISDQLTTIDNAIDKVKTDVNVIRTEVVKISADSVSQQRQIDDIKDELP